MNLTDQTILITGGTSGIGLELALALLQQGNKVIVTGRNWDKLKAAEQHGLHAIACDLEQQSDLERTVKLIENKYPDLNILVNNAGVQFNYLLTEDAIPFQKIRQEISINLTGQILLTQMLLPVLAEKQNALIINTTSGLGAFPKPDGIVYSAGKAGMRNFTVGLRYALRRTSIQVIEFIPPVTRTGMTAGRKEDKMDPKELISMIIPQIEKGKAVVTTKSIRFFLWIAFLFPDTAFKLLTK